MGDYRKLKVWQKAQAVAVKCRKEVRKIRRADDASFRRQIVTAAFSVPGNIVEGNGVHTAREYSRYVRVAINSSIELDYHLTTARDLGLLGEPKVTELTRATEEVRRMLNGLLNYLERLAKEEENRKRKQKKN